MQSFWAGGFAGVGGALVETPIDLLKSKIQIQTANRENVYTVQYHNQSILFLSYSFVIHSRGLLMRESKFTANMGLEHSIKDLCRPV